MGSPATPEDSSLVGGDIGGGRAQPHLRDRVAGLLKGRKVVSLF